MISASISNRSGDRDRGTSEQTGTGTGRVADTGARSECAGAGASLDCTGAGARTIGGTDTETIAGGGRRKVESMSSVEAASEEGEVGGDVVEMLIAAAADS